VTTIDTPANPTPASWTARRARELVLSRMSGISGGVIELQEGSQTRLVGEPVQGDPEPLSARVWVHRPRLFQRMLWGGTLGAGEAFIDGDWDCSDLTSLIRLLVRNERTLQGMDRGSSRLLIGLASAWHRLRRNSRTGSRRNISAHYDLGNEFFELFLDQSMMYSSAIFPNPESTLYEASIEKLDVICRKLRLAPGDRVVEIGTGWGGFAVHAAETYGCHVTTTTISREQHAYATRRVAQAGLQDRVQVLLEDYRDLQGNFDKLVSIEMIEAVGHQYFPTFFRKCGELLRPDGVMLLQGIMMYDQRYQEYLRSADFIQRYVFPGGCLPTAAELIRAAAKVGDLSPVHLEDYADHYARTLECWRERFQDRLREIRQLGFDERFVRIWDYYFCYCQAAFAERYIGLNHLMFARPQWRGTVGQGGASLQASSLAATRQPTPIPTSPSLNTPLSAQAVPANRATSLAGGLASGERSAPRSVGPAVAGSPECR